MREIFSPENSVILLIDHQIGTMGWVRSAKPADIEMNTTVLAKCAKAVNIPLILTSSQEDQAQGLLYEALRNAAPEAYEKRIQRAGIVDCMRDDNFSKAVKDTDRKNLIMAGITTDVCVVYPAMTALEKGYNIQVVVDACGSPTKIADETALRRMEAAGVTLTTTNQLIAELARDWSTESGTRLVQILFADILSRPN